MVTMTSESDKRQSSAIPAINVNATSVVILPKKLRSPTLGDAPNILVYKKVPYTIPYIYLCHVLWHVVDFPRP